MNLYNFNGAFQRTLHAYSHIRYEVRIMLKKILFISLAHCGFVFLAVTGGCSADIAAQMELAQNRKKDGYYRQGELKVSGTF